MSSNQRFSLVPRAVGLLAVGACAAGVFINQSGISRRPDPKPDANSLRATIQHRPLSFELNQGQASEGVRFLSRGSGYSFFLTKNEAVLGLAKMQVPQGAKELPKQLPAAVLRMRLANSNPDPKVVGEERLPGYSNYFLGRDKKQWRTNVPNFGRVRYKDVYPGIDLAYYGNQQQLEHDFIVKPGVDPKKIRLSYAGAKQIEITKEGELHFHTATGVVEQRAPLSYQKVDGNRKTVQSRYVMLAKNEIGFELGNYDRSKPLVIDPVLRYNRYIGGSIDEYAFDIDIDVDRNAYITGYTGSFDQPQDNRPGAVPTSEGGPFPNIPQRNPFPTVNPLMGDPDRSAPGPGPGYDLSTPGNGSIDGTWYFSRYDAFITKLSPTGGMVYSTYLGAEGNDYGYALAIDQSRNIYVTGQTTSVFWPLVFALQGTTNPVGGTDAFAVKINAAGNSLLYSTYLGGSGDDRGRAIAIDGTGNAYIAGLTSSTDFPTYARAGTAIAQATYGGGPNDAFLVSLNASGSAMNYSTYLGGSGNDDGASSNFGTGLNTGLNYTYRSPNYDITIPFRGLQPNPPVDRAMGIDWTVALAVDSKGFAVMGGGTNSADFPTTALTAVQAVKDTGYDGFVTQFAPSGVIDYSTFLGGNNDDAVRSVALGPNREMVMTGYTWSTNFPTSAPTTTDPTPAFRTTLSGNSDAFVTKLDKVGRIGTAGTYSTYLGGTGEDIGNGVIVSAGGQAYVTGSTASSGNSFPTENPYQINLRGGRDAFVTKFRPNGSEYEYSTYVGGTADDRGMAIAVDVPGGPANVQAYITGFTRSTTYPITLNSIDGNSFFNLADFAPAPDAIITKFHAPPFAASGLSLTDIQLRSVDMAWTDNSDNEDGFEIERKLGPADSTNLFAVVGVVGAGQVTFQDTNNVIPTTTYTYRVRAFNQETIGGGPQTFYGAYSNQLTVTTLPELPADASNLRVTPIDTSRLRLDWNDNSNNEAGFRIERAGESTPGSGTPGTFQEILTTAQDVTTFTDTGLSPDTLYFYRLFTFNAAGETLPLGPVSGRTLPLAPQVAPTNVVAQAVSSNRVNLSWNFPVTNTDPDGFKIERSNDGGLSYILIRITTKLPGVPAGLTLADTGVSGGSRYRYRIYAYNRSGDGPISTTNDATVLVAPSNLQGTIVSTTQIDLNWVDNSLAEDGYIVERSTDGGASYTQVGTRAANVTTFSDTTVTADGIYVYRVIAFKDTDAERDISTPTNLLNILALPSAPTMTSAHAIDSNTVQVDFVDNSTTETGFTIERDSGGGFTQIAGPAQVGPSAGSGGNVSYTDTSVSTETTYTYRVRATNGSGNSIASATDIAKVLAAPTNLNGTPTSSQVSLTWTDNSNLNDNYVVERSRNGGPYVTIVNNLGPNDMSYIDTTIVLDSVYDYRVRASASTDDFSSPDGPFRVTTPPGAPSNVQAVATSSSSVRVTWRDNSTTETSFRIIRSSGGAFTPLVSGLNSLPSSGGTGTYIDNTVSATVAAEGAYTYRVIAVNGMTESTESPSSNNVRVLAAPSNLVVAPATSQTRLVVSFLDNSDFESSYTLERAPETTPGSGVPGTFALVPIAIGPKPLHGQTITITDTTGLTAATRYFYRAYATTTNSISSLSNVDDEVTLPNPPTDPTSLTLTVISKSDIQLTWTDTADNEDGFRVKRSTDGVVYTTLSNILPASPNTGGMVTFDDNSVVEDTTYYYKVYAFNTGGNSGELGPVSGTTPPKAPSNLVATLTARNLITVTFKDNSVTETDFDLERSDDSGNSYARIALVNPAAGSGTTVTHLDGSVLPDKQYIYRVRARNSGGSSSDSNTDAEFTPPSDPSNLRLSGITNTSITLFWNDNSLTETQFVIERKTGSGMFAEIKRVSAGVNTYQDTGLQGATDYTYRVKATNGAPFDSNYSAEAQGTTLPDPPAKPLNLTVTPVSQTMLVLNWDDTSSNEDGFKIERASDGVNYTQIATVGANVHGYADSPLNVGTRYWYRVRAYNAGGNSAYSDPADAVTFPPVPAGPTGLSVTTIAPNFELRLRWTDNSTNEQEFLIERATDTQGLNFVEIASTNAPNVTSYSDTNLSPNATYHYRVRSSNLGGTSGPSNSASGLTLPAAPTNVDAVAQSGGSVNVTWTASTGGADGYVVFFVSAGQTAEAGRTSGNLTTFTHSGLLPNRSFRYFVRAFNRAGYSTDSNGDDVTTAGVGVVAFELSNSRVKGGKTVTGTVRLNGAAPVGGAPITFQVTGDGASLVKPITLTIPAGQTTGTVKIKTKKARRTANATLRATYNGAFAEVELTIAR